MSRSGDFIYNGIKNTTAITTQITTAIGESVIKLCYRNDDVCAKNL